MTAPPSRSLVDVVTALTADTVPYLSCDECFERICAYVEAVAADPHHRDVPMQTHLRACAVCAEEAAVLIELNDADLGRDRGGPGVAS